MSEAGPAVMWGGRFASPLDRTIAGYTGSLAFDRRLVRHDLAGCLAHARGLLEAGILPPEEAGSILEGLSGLLRDLEEGALEVEGEDEDVHSWIERSLSERIGETAGRLHTARSRNDQTGAALRLYTRERIVRLIVELTALQEALAGLAADHLETWLPGYTHLQRGQPISLAHHLLAHVWALLADGDRLRRAYAEAGTSPLGAAALAGTSFPIDPTRSAQLLGLERTFDNSVLAVADRDYVAETAFACALLMIHLSRWADEVVLWSGAEFGFVVLGDSIAQGSSLMPQKKNPEAAELIRGKSARAIGDLTTVLTLLKGLPFAYNSDFQEDKEALFDALDTSHDSVACATALVGGLEFQSDRMRAALHGGMVTATALADYLVRRGTPFRLAHERAGLAVRAAEAKGSELWELPLAELAEHCPGVEEDALEALRPETVARAHGSRGGPAPERVREQLADAGRRIRELRVWAHGLEAPPILRAHAEGRLLAEELA